MVSYGFPMGTRPGTSSKKNIFQPKRYIHPRLGTKTKRPQPGVAAVLSNFTIRKAIGNGMLMRCSWFIDGEC